MTCVSLLSDTQNNETEILYDERYHKVKMLPVRRKHLYWYKVIRDWCRDCMTDPCKFSTKMTTQENEKYIFIGKEA